MKVAKVFGSKNEIYEAGFALAVKFAIDTNQKGWLRQSDYEKVFGRLKEEHRCQIEVFSRSVENFNRQYPISTGLFLEMPVGGDAGDPIGVRYLLLEHETGLELFLAWLAGAAGSKVGKFVLDKVTDKAADKAIEAGFRLLCSFLREEWVRLAGVRIDHVEIRSEKKGVIRIPFRDFNPDQIVCLLTKFDHLEKIFDCNQECFSGLAFPHEPTDLISTEDRLRNSPTPPQARD